MAGVAISAGDFVHVMIVAVPAKARVGRVAIKAEVILSVDRRCGVRAEYGIGRGALLAASYASCMISGRPVTGFTLQLAVTEWSVRVSRICVCTFEQREDRFFLVT